MYVRVGSLVPLRIFVFVTQFLVYLFWVNNYLACCLNIVNQEKAFTMIVKTLWILVSSSSTKSMDQVYVSVPRPRQLTYLLHRSALPTLSPVAALHEYLDTGRPETARSRNLKYMDRYILPVSKHSHTSLIIGPVHRQYLMSAKKSTFLVVFASSCFTVLIIALCCNA